MICLTQKTVQANGKCFAALFIERIKKCEGEQGYKLCQMTCVALLIALCILMCDNC